MSDTTTGPAADSEHEAPPLDDMMLAMDVVDTLRRQERLVLRELDDAGREADLKQRLHKIYAQQGIEVPDHVLDQGVAALRQDRFTYKPPERSLATRLAYLYVTRGRWGKWVGGGLGVVILAFIGSYFAFVAPEAALSDKLSERHTELVELAASDNARDTAERLFNAGKTALRNEDRAAARQALAGLEDLRRVLEQEYTIQIVNRPGQRSGVWRVPDINTRARNYYIIVEAVDPAGRVLTVPVENEETGQTGRVEQWGLRVDEDTFEAVAADKQDNGIIERDRFGYKKRGRILPDYDIRTSGGAITQW